MEDRDGETEASNEKMPKQNLDTCNERINTARIKSKANAVKE